MLVPFCYGESLTQRASPHRLLGLRVNFRPSGHLDLGRLASPNRRAGGLLVFAHTCRTSRR